MRIQSMSVVVPNKNCVNNCAFCVSKMHCGEFKNQMDSNLPFYDLYLKDYVERLNFARDNGCNTVMLTGNSEPQQNRHFLQMFGIMNSYMLKEPFRCIEMQTTGVMLDENYLRFLRNHVRVSTISVSMNSFDDEINKSYIGAKDSLYVPLKKLCEMIKKYDFNLRLSINLTDAFNDYYVQKFFTKAKELKADQVTFRVLYKSNNNTPQDKWIEEHGCVEDLPKRLDAYIKTCGRQLERLEYGAMKYSVDGISTVIDTDCMSTEVKDTMKFLILRENCRLYSKWDDTGSLIF